MGGAAVHAAMMVVQYAPAQPSRRGSEPAMRTPLSAMRIA
jgi:hypothetical protein